MKIIETKRAVQFLCTIVLLALTGCQSTETFTYDSDIEVAITDQPDIYAIRAKVYKLSSTNNKNNTILTAPKVLARAGEEAVMEVSDKIKDSGVLIKVMVPKDKSEAKCLVQVKDEGEIMYLDTFEQEISEKSESIDTVKCSG